MLHSSNPALSLPICWRSEETDATHDLVGYRLRQHTWPCRLGCDWRWMQVLMSTANFCCIDCMHVTTMLGQRLLSGLLALFRGKFDYSSLHYNGYPNSLPTLSLSETMIGWRGSVLGREHKEEVRWATGQAGKENWLCCGSWTGELHFSCRKKNSE